MVGGVDVFSFGLVHHLFSQHHSNLLTMSLYRLGKDIYHIEGLQAAAERELSQMGIH